MTKKDQKQSDEVEKQEIVSFDERRKFLTHTTRETRNSEMGTLVIETKATLNEDGIRKTLEGLKERKKVLGESIEILKELNNPTPKMTPELEKLKADITILQKINHDKNTPENKRQEELKDLKIKEEEFKKTSKQISDMLKEIGDRLKL